MIPLEALQISLLRLQNKKNRKISKTNGNHVNKSKNCSYQAICLVRAVVICCQIPWNIFCNLTRKSMFAIMKSRTKRLSRARLCERLCRRERL